MSSAAADPAAADPAVDAGSSLAPGEDEPSAQTTHSGASQRLNQVIRRMRGQSGESVSRLLAPARGKQRPDKGSAAGGASPARFVNVHAITSAFQTVHLAVDIHLQSNDPRFQLDPRPHNPQQAL
jgi:hypothetical protein